MGGDVAAVVVVVARAPHLQVVRMIAHVYECIVARGRTKLTRPDTKQQYISKFWQSIDKAPFSLDSLAKSMKISYLENN